MEKMNEFATQRLFRVLEAIDIYRSLKEYDLKKSLSLDTFNANIRFQLQYMSAHIHSELNYLLKCCESNTITQQNEKLLEMEMVFVPKEGPKIVVNPWSYKYISIIE